MGCSSVWQDRTVKGSWCSPGPWRTLMYWSWEQTYLSLRELILFRTSMSLYRPTTVLAVYESTSKRRIRSLCCLQEPERLLFWACPRLASLNAVYITRVVNRAADVLSRTEPILYTDAVHLIWAKFASDLFASAETIYCKIWFSLNSQDGLLGLVRLGSTILLSAAKQRCKEGHVHT